MEAKDLDKDEVTRKACLDESFSPDRESNRLNVRRWTAARWTAAIAAIGQFPVELKFATSESGSFYESSHPSGL
jgi:hypothetical protein